MTKYCTLDTEVSLISQPISNMDRRLVRSISQKLDSSEKTPFFTYEEIDFMKTPAGRKLIREHKYYNQDNDEEDYSGSEEDDASDNYDDGGSDNYEEAVSEYDDDEPESEKEILPTKSNDNLYREGDPKSPRDRMKCGICQMIYTRCNRSHHARSRIHKVHQEIREQLFRNALNNDNFRLRPTDTM